MIYKAPTSIKNQGALGVGVTLTFDFLNPKVDRFLPSPREPFCQLASKSARSFSKYRVHKFDNARMNV